MNEIKEGMFIRTDDGKINKFKRYITDKKRVCETDMYARLAVDNIVKASFDIIDLIEVGDYVNGDKVVDKWEEPGWYGYFIKLDGEKTIPTIRHIETIVTREQFESMSYRTGE